MRSPAAVADEDRGPPDGVTKTIDPVVTSATLDSDLSSGDGTVGETTAMAVMANPSSTPLPGTFRHSDLDDDSTNHPDRDDDAMATIKHHDAPRSCSRRAVVLVLVAVVVGAAVVSYQVARNHDNDANASSLSSTSSSSAENGGTAGSATNLTPTTAPLLASTITSFPSLAVGHTPTARPIAGDSVTVSRRSVAPTTAAPSTSRPSSSAPTSTPSMVPTTTVPSSTPTLASPASSEISTATPSMGVTTASTTSTTTATTTAAPTLVLFTPGELTVEQNGLLLSTGLSSRLLATSGSPLPYANGQYSAVPFHLAPDAAQVFVDTRVGNNNGGWIYVSNSEVRPVDGVGWNLGGVGALTFNAAGDVIDYRRILNGTTANCGGGKTPWQAWISCEENGRGNIYQTDPLGVRPPTRITLGIAHPGMFESFAYDVRDPSAPQFFVTEDALDGAMQRFRPTSPDWNDPWTILTGEGATDFLLLTPTEFDDNGHASAGTFAWTTDKDLADANAQTYFPNTEGIDADGGTLYFVSKLIKMLFEMDLDRGTFTATSTQYGAFNGQPDQIQRLLASAEHGNAGDEYLFFTEDGGKPAGVHARLSDGTFVTILESSQYADETTGLAFSPDGRRLYIAYQDNGLLFEITRTDGLPFYATTLNVKYHATSSSSVRGRV